VDKSEPQIIALTKMVASVEHSLKDVLAYFGEAGEDAMKPEDFFAMVLTFSSDLQVGFICPALLIFISVAESNIGATRGGGTIRDEAPERRLWWLGWRVNRSTSSEHLIPAAEASQGTIIEKGNHAWFGRQFHDSWTV
jgi:hypothetical protein